MNTLLKSFLLLGILTTQVQAQARSDTLFNDAVRISAGAGVTLDFDELGESGPNTAVACDVHLDDRRTYLTIGVGVITYDVDYLDVTNHEPRPMAFAGLTCGFADLRANSSHTFTLV